MSSLHLIKLHINEREHGVDLLIKQRLQLFSIRYEYMFGKLLLLQRFAHLVNTKVESSILAPEWQNPGARPGTGSGIVGTTELAAVPYEHLILSNLPCIMWSAMMSGSPCRWS